MRKIAFFGLIPWTLMAEAWRYTSILSRWCNLFIITYFIIKKRDRKTVNFLYLCVHICMCVPHPCLSFISTTASSKNGPLICYWVVRQEDYLSQIRMLYKDPYHTSFYTETRLLCKHNMLKCLEVIMSKIQGCHPTSFWGMAPPDRFRVYCLICHDGQREDQRGQK